uniref:Uncharacterized protein n=1 Tax=Arundo donax TaxID=35708 RepID=A0A0A9CWV5_ARUDO
MFYCSLMNSQLFSNFLVLRIYRTTLLVQFINHDQLSIDFLFQGFINMCQTFDLRLKCNQLLIQVFHFGLFMSYCLKSFAQLSFNFCIP